MLKLIENYLNTHGWVKLAKYRGTVALEMEVARQRRLLSEIITVAHQGWHFSEDERFCQIKDLAIKGLSGK